MSERDLTIEEFCDLHEACKDGREWALANCSTLQDCWEKLHANSLIWVATRNGVLPDKQLRLFAVFCCRQIWHLLTDERSRKAVEVAEKHANGQATDEELDAAWTAADAVVLYTEEAAAWHAARAVRAATYNVAWAAACTAAAAAAGAAARDAADDAVGNAEYRAAYVAAQDTQAAWLRANTTPNFRKVNHERT